MNNKTDEQSGDLVARCRRGDQQAAAALFRRYAGRLVALARSELSSKLSRRIDPEDVVHSAYRSFFSNIQDGRYDLERGGDLWRLLVRITLHKLSTQVRRHSRQKRSARHEITFGSEDSLLGISANLLAHEPSPAEAVTLADHLEQTMRRLNPGQRRVLELRLQGYKLEEIASALQRSERTVRRMLEEIVDLLGQWGLESSGS
jgi:RNA polymerase sigma-70 factor (ECF subfamily)